MSNVFSIHQRTCLISHTSAYVGAIRRSVTGPLDNTTVKTLYNVTRYNRIFNIRHKIAGNGSVSIIIPSL